MVDLSHRRQPLFLLTHLAEGGDIGGADLAPGSPVAFVDLRVTLIPAIVLVRLLGVGFVVAGVGESWAARPPLVAKRARTSHECEQYFCRFFALMKSLPKAWPARAWSAVRRCL